MRLRSHALRCRLQGRGFVYYTKRWCIRPTPAALSEPEKPLALKLSHQSPPQSARPSPALTHTVPAIEGAANLQPPPVQHHAAHDGPTRSDTKRAQPQRQSRRGCTATAYRKRCNPGMPIIRATLQHGTKRTPGALGRISQSRHAHELLRYVVS